MHTLFVQYGFLIGTTSEADSVVEVPAAVGHLLGARTAEGFSISTALHTGTVAVERLEVRDDPPPSSALEAWEAAVAVSWTATGRELLLYSFDEAFPDQPELPRGPGQYRVLVAAKGRRESAATEDHMEFGAWAESFAVWTWPEPWSPPPVIKSVGHHPGQP